MDHKVHRVTHSGLFIEVLTMSECESDASVSKVMDDLRMVTSRKTPKRPETTFFQVVQGGDIKLTVSLLSELKKTCNENLLEWVLGEDCKPTPDYHQERTCIKRTCTGFVSSLVLLVIAIFSLVLTPVYYILFSVTRCLANVTFARPLSSFNLPLTLVSLSQSREMVELFKEEGVSLFQEDEHQNTVFHHLAYLSKTYPEKAIQIFNLIIEVYSDSDIRRALKIENHLTFDGVCLLWLSDISVSHDGVISHNMHTSDQNH